MCEIAGQQQPYLAEGKPIGMNAIVVMDYPLN
jgi:hypothetical protein